jgi:GNAT superfamily N-acetyltransferase
MSSPLAVHGRELIIRFATPSDAEIVYRFIAELAAYEKEPAAVEVTSEILREQLASARPPFECLIASQEDWPVGFALFFHNYSTWRGKRGLYIEDIYVPESHRGQGIGTALFQAVGRIALERDCGRMEWAVLNWNTPAIEFYCRQGAKPLDEWTIFRMTREALADFALQSSNEAE